MGLIQGMFGVAMIRWGLKPGQGEPTRTNRNWQGPLAPAKVQWGPLHRLYSGARSLGTVDPDMLGTVGASTDANILAPYS